MNTLIDIAVYPVRNALKTLLVDKTTKQNIVYATDSYSSMDIHPEDHIESNTLFMLGSDFIQPRVLKNKQAQTDRTKSKAEVMTPAWIVNKMNNHCDEDWFGYPNVFNTEKDKTWETNYNPISFPDGKNWQDYVRSMRLEITCGEAPYLVSRYDTTTGEVIPVKDRIGILDRKLRVVGENTSTKEDWLKWAIKAYESTYGYEYQGDNLLIGRINLLITFVDYMMDKWGEMPTESEVNKIANIIAWNVWQMDGITGCIPFAYDDVVIERQISLFEIIGVDTSPKVGKAPKEATIYNWKSKKAVTFNSLKEN